MNKYDNLADTKNSILLIFLEQYRISELRAELSTLCHAGPWLLQALGLRGWMYDGINRHTVLGATGESNIPGLGFRCDTDSVGSMIIIPRLVRPSYDETAQQHY